MLAWLGLLARGFLVASDASIYFGPESACLDLLVDGVLCLYTQDPVAHFLFRRCALHSLCPCFNFVLQTCRPCLRVLNLPWSFPRVFNVSRFLVWLRAKHASTCDAFLCLEDLFCGQQLLQPGCLHRSRVVLFLVLRGRLHQIVVCPQDLKSLAVVRFLPW